MQELNAIEHAPVLIIGGGITGLTACLFLLLKGLHEEELILVRPDGFIAWRGIDEGQAAIEVIIKSLLSRNF